MQPSLEKLYQDIIKMPSREELLGGQRTRYLQRDEVLGYIEIALKVED